MTAVCIWLAGQVMGYRGYITHFFGGGGGGFEHQHGTYSLSGFDHIIFIITGGYDKKVVGWV